MARSVKTRLARSARRPKDSNRTRASHFEGASRFAEGAGISSGSRRHAASHSGASGATAMAWPPRRRWLLYPPTHRWLPQQPCSRRSQRLLLYDSTIEVMRPSIFTDTDTPRVVVFPGAADALSCARRGRHGPGSHRSVSRRGSALTLLHNRAPKVAGVNRPVSCK